MEAGKGGGVRVAHDLMRMALALLVKEGEHVAAARLRHAIDTVADGLGTVEVETSGGEASI